MDLGVEPFLVSSALIGVIAQRMVRRICPNCSSPTEISTAEKMAYTKEMNEEKNTFMYGSGCKNCSNTGYRGRFSIIVRK
jgi:general secretion pathway protein E